MPRTVALSVQSRTGNTRLIADALREHLISRGWQVEDLAAPEAAPTIAPTDISEPGGTVVTPIVTPADARICDVLIICFWCDRSTLDPNTRELIAACTGRRVLAFGTMGGYPDSPYAEKVTANVSELIGHANTCLGVCLSQGRVSMDNVERRRMLPVDHPHHLDDAGVARLVESQKHPDASDIARAVAFLDAHLAALAGE